MKIIKQLLKERGRFRNPEAPKLLTECSSEVVQILYFSAKVTSSGYYRMLLPLLELTKTKKFKTHLIGLSKEDFSAPFELAKVPLLDDWVLWADYMVFPLLTVDFMYFFQACKVINPELQIVMDVDFLPHTLPSNDPLRKKTTKEMFTAIQSNMNLVDIVTSHNEHILDYCQVLLEERYSNTHTFLTFIPNLISKIGYDEVTNTTASGSDKVRIGMLTSIRTVDNILLIRNVLKKIQATFRQKVVFVIFGWNGTLQDGSTPLAELEIEYHKPVDFINYFEKLSKLQLDMALLPLRNKATYRFASDTPYLELASLGIPVIASENSIYVEYILDGKTGSLVKGIDQWQITIKKYIEDKAYSSKLGKAAKKHVWECYSYTKENIEIFSEVFI